MSRSIFVGLCAAGWAVHGLAGEMKPVPVIERAGRAYVSAAALEAEAGIAIKSLPGQTRLAACAGERCALIGDYLREENRTLVPAETLARALGAKAEFDATRQTVRFHLPTEAAPPANPVVQVGQLAPNFRLPLLDGRTMALSELRGKRVLINSWASW